MAISNKIIVKSYEITCIKRVSPSSGLLTNMNKNNKISHIGYKSDYGITRVIEVSEAVEMLNTKQCTFYIRSKLNQNIINVEVVNNKGYLSDDSYLRSIHNDVKEDNLEELPKCKN